MKRKNDLPDNFINSSDIEELNKLLDEIKSLIRKAKDYNIKFIPENLQSKLEDVDEYVEQNLATILQAKAMKKWQTKWKESYENQKPKFIVTPIIAGLTPLQSILLGLLKANVRTIPLMQDVLQDRSRITIYNALKGLVEKGYVFQTNASFYFESNWDIGEAKQWTKNYMASRRNPNGVIPKVRYYDMDEHSSKVLKIMHESERWNKIKNFKSSGLL